MKFFNKDLGSRLWGMSFVLWFITCLDFNYFLWIRILSALVFVYFISYGNSRFTEEYKRVI